MDIKLTNMELDSMAQTVLCLFGLEKEPILFMADRRVVEIMRPRIMFEMLQVERCFTPNSTA